ncbi:MAG: hypothetical protein PHH26_00700 [Candidatus Thermoplasmatota archaeon]|nr:hypothetical protein [Candidatus Thermoplasmatota archaeon]
MENEIVNDNPVEAAVETPEAPELETPVMEVETPAESVPEAEPPEPLMVPVKTVEELREDRRVLREENLRLRQALTPPPPPPVEEVEEESPLEKFAKEVGEEVPPDAKTLIAQQKFEKDQAKKKAQQTVFATNMNNYQAGLRNASLTMTDETMGEGLGFDSLMAIGNDLLTQGDRLDVFQAGTNAGKEAYRRLTQRILQKGGKPAQALRAKLDSRAKQLKELKAKGSDIENPPPVPKPKVHPTQEQILTEFSDPFLNSVFSIPPKTEE